MDLVQMTTTTESAAAAELIASWMQIESEVPELAALARRFFDAGLHKTLATLRRNGSPRIGLLLVLAEVSMAVRKPPVSSLAGEGAGR